VHCELRRLGAEPQFGRRVAALLAPLAGSSAGSVAAELFAWPTSGAVWDSPCDGSPRDIGLGH